MVRYLIVASLMIIIFTASPSIARTAISENIQTANDSIYHYETNSAETRWREQSTQTVEVKMVMDEFGPNIVKITNIKLHLYLDFSNSQDYQMETPNKDIGSIEKEGGWFTYYFTTDIPRTSALFINFVIRSDFIEMMDSGIEYLNQDEFIQVGGVGIIDKTVDTQFNTTQRSSSIYPVSIFLGLIFHILGRKYKTSVAN